MRKAYRLDGGAKREIQGMRTSSGISKQGQNIDPELCRLPLSNTSSKPNNCANCDKERRRSGRSAFSEEIWTDWEAGKREQFEARWPKVQEVLAAFEDFGIYLMDVTPNNIAFLE